MYSKDYVKKREKMQEDFIIQILSTCDIITYIFNIIYIKTILV